ncbi:FecR family protein [Sphingobacterium faecale]|uniref:FecR family protein n=1 Tax=Sphingobacterium faecale TaxID=2803775 RepID=A0ABS1R0Q1_9SPHI|nr:FecR family protein [Sphingobacterium faecale]MBL1408274.1 FecR family protein [Sphingobacterium faecale]
MTNYNYIVQLFKKKIQGTIDLEENELLEDWARGREQREQLLKDISTGDLLLEEVELWLDLEHQDNCPWNEKLFLLVQNKIDKQVDRNKTFLGRKILYAAAVVILLFSAGIGLYLFKSGSAQLLVDKGEVLDVASGKNRATITLADGRVVRLDESKEGLVIGEDLTYTDGSTVVDMGSRLSQNIILTVPKGGKYQVTLSDGSKVWLNAESRLVYPHIFSQQERFVELMGEAYFDIVPKIVDNKRVPFLVKTKDQTIEVLGTQFNVKAYPDENEMATVLIEGVVRIQSDKHNIKLLPGEMWISNSLGVRKISQVDTDEYLAWKNNKFIFNETPLKEAMRQLSRWYDVHVEYENSPNTTFFYGEISREKSLLSVLNILQESGVKFKLRKDNQEVILQVSP